jgi:GntR family transcriptional regulator
MADILTILSLDSRERKNLSELIVERIMGLISDGHLKPGDQLPSEVELAQAFNVSRTTVREALNILQQDGTVIRRHGVGTFVTSGHLLRNRLDISQGVTELIRSLGRTPGVSRLDVDEISADSHWAELLAVEPGEPLIRVDRVRTADGKPVIKSMALFRKSLLQERSPRISEEEVVEYLREKLSLLRFMEERLGRPVDYTIARLEPLLADEIIARELGINQGGVLIRLEQVDYDASGEPLIASHEHHIAEASVFTVFRKR